METLYKVMSKEYESINGGSFNWKDYLPKGKKKGKWTSKIKNISICCHGYHLTKHWNMWLQSPDNIVYEAEAKEIKAWDYDKCVCDSVRLIRKVDLYFLENDNIGEMNTGKFNTGYRNTGYRNTGDRNTGGWNTGDRNTGCFNTKEPKYIELFNKSIKREKYNEISFPSYFYFDLDEKISYQENWLKAFKKAGKQEVKNTIKLPNFDYKIFEEITGITKKMIKSRS